MIFALFEYNIYATIKNVIFSKFEHRRLDCYNNEIIFEPFRKTLSMPFVGEDYWLESIIILRFLFSWNYG